MELTVPRAMLIAPTDDSDGGTWWIMVVLMLGLSRAVVIADVQACACCRDCGSLAWHVDGEPLTWYVSKAGEPLRSIER